MTFRSLLALAVVGVISAAPARAQSVLLRIHPRVGDTLAVRMNQKVEMTGTPIGCATSSEKRAEACLETTRTMASMTEVFSRAIVRKESHEGVVVLTVTDSIRAASAPAGGRLGKPVRMNNQRNRSFEMRVSNDGGAEVVDSDATDEMRALFGQMPATLSKKPVEVGEEWKRQMRVPIAGEAGAYALVRATFQLDSLSGDIAYISMRGTLAHDHRDGSDSELSGSMSGIIQLDRRLGWITDTRVVIDANSVVKMPNVGQKMRVRTKVTQLLHAGSAR
jgi:hypothetical protein